MSHFNSFTYIISSSDRTNSIGTNTNTYDIDFGGFNSNCNDYSIEILNVLLYPKNIRYVLEGIPNVAYTEDELMEAPKNVNESKFAVRKLIDRRGVGRTIYYKVWFMKELKKDANWITKKQLLEDGLDDYIDEYENNLKK